ncbi:c2 domain-containing protein [Ditylenchus destructor]|uniref:C2 domain-containing protein n=1 Tax=Ditylenchus destructor TaxID=166010 RepID=A0AAD4MZR3_9BILA|nr:c2 domain-containing protein [Ditylenchus destructor]
MRRLSSVTEVVNQASVAFSPLLVRRESFSQRSSAMASTGSLLGRRRPSQQESEDSALLFLERRKSSDTNVGQIQPDLYRRRGSIISVGMGSVGNDSDVSGGSPKSGKNAGRVQFQLSYDFSKSDFVAQLVRGSIHISQLEECQFWLSLESGQDRNCGLQNTSQNNFLRRTDSLCLEKSEGGASICGGAGQIRFPLSYDELLESNLIVELVSTASGSVGNRRCSATISKYGRASVSLASLRPSDDELLIWVDLDAINDIETSHGELKVCLQYLPSAQSLTLTVHEATNLPTRTMDALPNTFVRSSLILDDKTILKKRKTSVRKATISPVWNEALTFGIDQKLISRCRLEVCVMDCDRFGNSRPIGRITFSSKQPGNTIFGYKSNASRLWRDAVVQASNFAVLPQWLSIESPTSSPACD